MTAEDSLNLAFLQPPYYIFLTFLGKECNEFLKHPFL